MTPLMCLLQHLEALGLKQILGPKRLIFFAKLLGLLILLITLSVVQRLALDNDSTRDL